jgi:hypothetical protein
VVRKERKNNRVVAVHGTVVLGDHQAADAAREASVCSRTNKYDIRFGRKRSAKPYRLCGRPCQARGHKGRTTPRLAGG